MGRKKSNLEASPKFQLEYFKTLINESDRGLVLLTASMLDELLEHLHRTYFRSIPKHEELFINKLFSAYAPLSTFAAKTELAFGYGLIPKELYIEINLVHSHPIGI